MKKLKFLCIVLFSLLINSFSLNAAEVKGAADIYKVKMHKLELCTGHTPGDMDDVATSTTQCQDAVTIGTSTAGVEVDIASVSEGAVAGNFGDAMLLPLGETYTHVRVTLNRNMKIRTKKGINTGGGGDVDNCKTKTTTDAMYATNEATDKYTHKPVVQEHTTGTATEDNSEEMSLYIVNGRQFGDSGGTISLCQDEDCGSVSAINWNYAENASRLNSAKAMQTMRSSVTTDQLAMIYALETPYTVSLVTPKIDMSFSTSQAIMAENVVSDTLCAFAIAEPTVTITME
tara:strand:+ start:123 stop:986 length:864 start_codon:yes stop_codon:yes gene_type:complete